MAYSHFDKFKAFFLALNKSGYHPERMDPKIITPQDKAYCFEWLLKEIPELKGKSNNDLIEFLRDPKKVKTCIAGHFVQKESTELTKILEEKPVTEAVEQQGGQEAVPSGQEVQPAGATGSSGGMPSMPGMNMPSAPSLPRIYNIPHAESGMAGGQGTGSAATNKIDQLKAEQTKVYGQGTAASSKGFAPSASPRFNFSNFRSKVGNGIAGAARTGLEKANPLLKQGGNALVNGLTNIANPGGIQGIGGGSRNILGKIGNLGRGAGKGETSALRKAGANWGKRAFILLILGFVLLGGVAISGTPTTGEAVPISSIIPPIAPSDISSCQFTRGDRNPKEASFKSPLLLSYIQEASGLTKIPAAVLAAFIRVESPSTVDFTDEQIKSYQCIETGPGKNVSTSGALGIMQLQPEGTEGNDRPALTAGAKLIGKEYSQLTKADYCDVRKNIIMGAGFILMKLSYKGMETSPPLTKGFYPVYGDGTQWDPAWTNDNQAISKLVNGYYGCLQYPSCSSGPYNYASDVSTSIQNCRVVSSGTVPPPPTDGNYQKWPEGIGIKMANGFSAEVYKWAYEILYQAATTYPKFKDLIHNQCPLITFEPTAGISHADGCIIPLSFNSGETFFKFLIIHELGHKINTTSWKYNSDTIAARKADSQGSGGGFLTYYSEHAGRAADIICGDGDDDGNRSDEDFAESVAYYINSLTKEQNMRTSECGTIWPINPFEVPLANGQKRYQAHYQLMESLLK